jgi:D-glycero-beta-D-manno-heptose-7-phosphate kinase
MLDAGRARDLIAHFQGATIAVLGDFVADVYLDAAPARLSREAPVLVTRWEAERSIPGGAANAVNNLVALGARVHPAGVVGDDGPGRALRDFFVAEAASADAVILEEGGETVAKTRVMVGAEGRSRQQVLRIDREPASPPRPSSRAQVLQALRGKLVETQALIISDYGYGNVDRNMVEELLAHPSAGLVIADSRFALPMMRGVTLAKPNHAEAEALVGHPVISDEDCLRAGRKLLSDLEVRSLLLTRGNRGMMLLDAEGDHVFLPALDLPGEVTDVSGAGDTVVSLLALALAVGATPREAAALANAGAAVVVGKLGAATVSPEELLAAVTRGQGGQ